MRARRAKISDTPAIYGLIAHYAEEGLLLSRTEDEGGVWVTVEASAPHFPLAGGITHRALAS